MGKYEVLAVDLDENDKEAGEWPDGRPKLVHTYHRGDEVDLSDTTEERIQQFLDRGVIREAGKEPVEKEGVEAEQAKRLAAGELPDTTEVVTENETAAPAKAPKPANAGGEAPPPK
jgi:hypothetical protein